MTKFFVYLFIYLMDLFSAHKADMIFNRKVLSFLNTYN